MTREEAITVLEGLFNNPLLGNQHKIAFNIAIHDIKQRHDWDINNLILINKDNYDSLEQESCEDCISRKAILECQYTIDENETLGISTRNVVNVDDILNAKPIQLKTGHWIEVAKYSDGKHKIKCSECRSHFIDRGHANSCVVKEKYKYCPRCGARMIEPQESEEA